MFTTGIHETSETCLNLDKAQNQIRSENHEVAGIKGSDGGDWVKLPRKLVTSCDGGGEGDLISAYSPSEESSDLASNLARI